MNTLLGQSIQSLTTQQLTDVCKHLDTEYRKGSPVVTDELFDRYFIELETRNPYSSFVNQPQNDSSELTAKGRVKHTSLMLSTQKAYSIEEIESFINRCESAAYRLGKNPKELMFKITSKLDGVACKAINGNQLVTRGCGQFGSDVSELLNQGLVVKGSIDMAFAVGEIVMDQQYFDQYLASEFAHPRNVVAGLVNAQTLSQPAINALRAGAVHLCIFNDMKNIVVSSDDLIFNFEALIKSVKNNDGYPFDGTVIEIIDEDVKEFLGSNSHHHLWQIAFKQAGETAIVEVVDVSWQTGRTGRVSPILHIQPTLLSGATISKITAHHAKNILVNGLGKGAIIEIIRSGEIIPKALKTLRKVSALVPKGCPSCAYPLHWKNDFLVCEGDDCSANINAIIQHHFKIIGCDLFGQKSVQKLIDSGYKKIEQIYDMSTDDFVNCGFGSGQARNLVAEMERVIREPLRDNLLLASLGISKLGRSASKKILMNHRIDELNDISANDIIQIDGFAEVTSTNIAAKLAEKQPTLQYLLSKGFNLQHTQDQAVKVAVGSGTLAGKTIVFTGKMAGNRDEMKADAESKGAVVSGSVSAKTSILCCGEKVGAKKIEAAKAKGVEIITEADYWSRF